MRHTPDFLFVGVYSAKTFQTLALMDREHVQIHLDNNQIDFENVHIAITSNQICALIAHIVSSSPAFTRIDVAGLNFLCLKSKSNACLTGTSNFNVDHHNRKCLQESCDHLYEVSYTVSLLRISLSIRVRFKCRQCSNTTVQLSDCAVRRLRLYKSSGK
ncbi:hypothetical protein DPMN_043048 [Dreissena polymorpha]|uniref:Uncharacterized protein n=1 Tax=Dreissena polymorpha TaxID=45954 RepID=A0A9D4HXG2_DREPO|nr:hypothetical protein DPMN_043048 [Dreissena polymorpha]